MSAGWVAEAACRGSDPELFHDDHRKDEARAVCAECPVTAACLEHALEHREKRGIWGGKTPEQRRYLRRQQGPVVHPPKPCAFCGRSFSPHPRTPWQATCGAEVCRRQNERRQQREWARAAYAARTSMLEQGHGTISRYMTGCHCPACRAVGRERRAAQRARIAISDQEVA